MDADHDILEVVVARRRRQVLEADQQVLAAGRDAGQDLMASDGLSVANEWKTSRSSAAPSVPLARVTGTPALRLAGPPVPGVTKLRLSGRLP